MRVKCAAARKEAWQKERAGYSTCHHRLERGLRRSSFDSSFNDSYSVYIWRKKSGAKNERTNDSGDSNSIQSIIYDIFYKTTRKDWNENFFPKYRFFSFEEKSHFFRSRARYMIECNNWASESKKMGKKIARSERTWHEGHANRVREVECTEIERRWERAARTMTQKIQTGRGEADSRNASFLRFLPYARNISRLWPKETRGTTRFTTLCYTQPWKA